MIQFARITSRYFFWPFYFPEGRSAYLNWKAIQMFIRRVYGKQNGLPNENTKLSNPDPFPIERDDKYVVATETSSKQQYS